MNQPRPPRRMGNLTDEQAALLAKAAVEATTETAQITRMMLKYIEAGGRDWETFERFCDHLARQGMELIMAGRGALTPEAGDLARHQVVEAAGISIEDGGPRELVHQGLAASILMAVYFAGQHHLVEPADWPELTAAAVLGAVRTAPAVNNDPLMRNPPAV